MTYKAGIWHRKWKRDEKIKKKHNNFILYKIQSEKTLFYQKKPLDKPLLSNEPAKGPAYSVCHTPPECEIHGILKLHEIHTMEKCDFLKPIVRSKMI